jgi:hypothetical protein
VKPKEISWQLFFETLRKKPTKRRQEWLGWWSFGNEGAQPKPQAGDRREISKQSRERQRRAVLIPTR